MANDQRDYNVDRIRKRTNYTEKARFRVSLANEKREHLPGKKRTGLHPVWIVFFILCIVAVLATARKLLA